MTTAPADTRTGEQTTRVVRAVDACLAHFVSARSAELACLDPDLQRLARAAGDAVLRPGKRLRPVFAYWGWRGAVGPDRPLRDVIPALAALEMLHTFAIVQDDVMDDAAVRRGQPSAHAALADGQRRWAAPQVAEQFGRSAAILAGDLCLVWADQLLARAALPSATILRAREVYDRMRVEAIAGQFLDVLGEASPRWSLRRATRVVRLKTASYSVVRPLHFGLNLATLDACCGPAGGQADALTEAYERYGAAVGEAFQLRDDLLDAYGDPAVTGKPYAGDLARGRPTVLLELARCLATEAQRAELASQLATGGADPARTAALVAGTGAPQRVERWITGRVADALSALAGAPMDPVARSALADLAHLAADRIS